MFAEVLIFCLQYCGSVWIICRNNWNNYTLHRCHC